MNKKHLSWASALAIAALCASQPAKAEDQKWWPLKVVNLVENKLGGKAETIDYSPVENAAKAHKICVLFPHLKDSIWLAADYGLVTEAERMGVNLNIFEAGGYENLPRQIAQFDDCMAGGYEAIIVGAISEGGLAQKFREAKEAGIPTIALLNTIMEAPVTARVYPDTKALTKVSAAYVAQAKAGADAKVVTFPGPAGSGWAELFNDDFRAAASAYPNIEVIGDRFGDAGVAAQLSLIQDALQSYPEMNVLYGGGPAIEAAVAVLEAVGREDVLLVPTYENDAVHALVKEGKVASFASQFPVAQGRLALDMAVRAIEGTLTTPFVYPEIQSISTDELKNMDMTKTIAAPPGFSAVYSVTVD